MSYQRFIREDDTIVHAYERYADSEAALTHLQNFEKKFAQRFLGLVDRLRLTVYGTPSAELKGVLDALGAVYLTPFGGFNYWP